ncbi:MAG: hypothetical protein PVG65_01125 [Candidatus Thorarchaeota archaeon]
MSEEVTKDEETTQAEVDVKEVLSNVKLKDGEAENKEAENLVDEFNSFLEVKTELSKEPQMKRVMPSGIDLLDTVLGGGFAIGALNIIVGQPGSGKSMLAAQTYGSGQKKFPDMIGGFLDSEEAMTKLRLYNLGVQNPSIDPYTNITVEKVFQLLEGICLFKEKKKIVKNPSMAVWDSIANTLTQKEIETDDPNSVIGYKARLLSLLIPKYVAKCAKYSICFLAVNQLRDDIQMGIFPNPKELKFLTQGKTMPGGNVLKFNAFHLLEMKVGALIQRDKYGFDGVISKIKCVKNKLFPPNIEVELVGSFVYGFSNFWTNYNMLVKTKRLDSGAWNKLVSLPNKKFRTKDAEDLYIKDEEFKSAFDKSVEEALKHEYIDKYTTIEE